MKKYIIINGMMGVGKSTIGRRIAELLGRAALLTEITSLSFTHISTKTKPNPCKES